jgi:hypothetical protein
MFFSWYNHYFRTGILFVVNQCFMKLVYVGEWENLVLASYNLIDFDFGEAAQ